MLDENVRANISTESHSRWRVTGQTLTSLVVHIAAWFELINKTLKT